LRLTPDAVKDQTYFLANLSAGQLARCMFPLGPFTKPQVQFWAAMPGPCQVVSSVVQST
jgi:tRNA-specific 2-thiouridylase